MNLFRKISSQPRARLTGAIYLLYFATAILAQSFTSSGFVSAGNLVNVFATICYFVVTVLFYLLFKPVSHIISAIAALFSFAGCIDMSLDLFHIDSPLSPLVFFGPFCLLLGYLILRSLFLPRFLGVMMLIAGVGWLAYLIPGNPQPLSLAIMVIGFLSELALCLWLLIKGVKITHHHYDALEEPAT
jgi:hypothetical protein